MRSTQIAIGRQFMVVFDDGADFLTALATFCRENEIRQGVIPGFIAGFREVDIVGTCDKIENPDAPVWTKVHLETTEAHGTGTLAWDETTGAVAPHIHVSVGLKGHSAAGYTSHLLGAKVQFLTEMLVMEVAAPDLNRVRDPDLYDAPLMRF
jgi:predicted DNA-binding protein with PD1-like motif